MKLAVMADIHSNYVALEQCMAYALKQGVRHFVFLGDYIGELAYPERTMALLYGYREKYDCAFIRGNKEEYWLQYKAEGEQGWREYDSTTGVLWYAYHRLRERDLDFFEHMPIARRLQFGELQTLFVCHGTPDSTRKAMRWKNGDLGEGVSWGNAHTEEVLERCEEKMLLCGHTHVQGRLEYGGKILLNPGAVGLPLEKDGRSRFVILHGDGGGWQEEFVSLPYDRVRVIREIDESGLGRRAPYWSMITKRHLMEHTDCPGHAVLLERAMEICRQTQGFCNWPDIPEDCWRQALEEIGIL